MSTDPSQRSPAAGPITPTPPKADDETVAPRPPGEHLDNGNMVTHEKSHNDSEKERGIKEEHITPEPDVLPEQRPSEDAPASVEAQLDTPMSDAVNDGATSKPGGSSSVKNPDRVNRKDKRFVATNKDPRARDMSKGKKRAADGSVKNPNQEIEKQADKDGLNLPYRSIKAINMPPRIGILPGKVPPIPDRNSLPFGNTEDYYNSMIIHWCDEHEVGYGTAADLYNAMFPEDKITLEALRRRHIRSLQRLVKKYGAKPVALIGPVGQKVLRRGKARALALRAIVAETNRPAGSAEVEDAGNITAVKTPRPGSRSQPENAIPHLLAAPHDQPRVKRRALKSKDFEKACIVVWKDSLEMDFKAIRDKLETQYTWSLGLAIIEKYYYQNLDRVYGTPQRHTEDDQVDEDVVDQEVVAEGRVSRGCSSPVDAEKLLT